MDAPGDAGDRLRISKVCNYSPPQNSLDTVTAESFTGGVNHAALLALSRDELIALTLAQHAQIEAQAQQISALTTRIAEPEVKLAAPPKTPDNSACRLRRVKNQTCPIRRETASPEPPGVTGALNAESIRRMSSI